MNDCNGVETVWGERLDEDRKESAKWRAMLGLELAYCRQSGCVGMGTHIIAVVRKPTQESE